MQGRPQFKLDRNFNLEHQQHIPTMQSIEAQSEISVDLRHNDLEPLISKIFLLCIELERKDICIERLQQEAQRGETIRSQVDVANREWATRLQKMEAENSLLMQDNSRLQYAMADLDRRAKEVEYYKEKSSFNKGLEDKVQELEAKLRQYENARIEDTQKIATLKRENSILSFTALKTNQKHRLKQLEAQISAANFKLQQQMRLSSELRVQQERNLMEIKRLRQNEATIKSIYQERLQRIEVVKQSEEMKKSHIATATEEKVVLLSQELHRLRQEIQYMKGLLKDEKDKLAAREEQTRQLNVAIRAYEDEIKRREREVAVFIQENKRKEDEYLLRIENYENAVKNLKVSHSELERTLAQRSSRDNELAQERQKLRQQLLGVEQERNGLRAQVKKLKRKTAESNTTECEVCKIRTSMGSSRNIKESALDLEALIKEAEALSMSNKKISDLINHHELITQHSQQTIETRTTSQISSLNISLTK